ncbi:condensation domain-containing protein, partial [Streptomyces sp. C10-9-1]|uniref:condensation domain-containing protein n=1 Tax=Streptomyces sp. C10-9-1 TaxID=1859285 RepID=UPI003D758664
LVETIAPERSLSRHPLFQTMVAYEGGGPDLSRLLGTAAEEWRVRTGAAKFDLEILFRRGAGGAAPMTCGVRFATDLFERETAERLASRLVRLLEQVTARPDAPLTHVDLLESAERELVLRTFNDTARARAPRTLDDLSGAGARRDPEAPALVFEGEELSRAAFEDRVNRL